MVLQWDASIACALCGCGFAHGFVAEEPVLPKPPLFLSMKSSLKKKKGKGRQTASTVKHAGKLVMP